MKMLLGFLGARRQPATQVAKSAVATIAAWLIATWVVNGALPVFAAIAALLVVQPSVNQSALKAIERSVGVISGVGIASGLTVVFGQAPWVALVAVTAALVLAWLLRMTPGTTYQIAISALLAISLGSSTPNYAVDRIVETIIGAATGFVVNLIIVPPVALAPAKQAVSALGEEVAKSMERLSESLTSLQTPAKLEELMIKVRLLRPMVSAADDAIADAQESLTLNPRARKHREDLEQIETTRNLLRPIVSQVMGMTRAVYDHYDKTLASEPSAGTIAEQLQLAAQDVRRRSATAAPGTSSTDSGSTDLSERIPLVSAPLTQHEPSSDHWILVGSLLEDLRRIREELAARD
ncbi:aromatic acid exporter family protein [Salinibacterium sp. ZJ70]|uniref:FUSC family protein n=1 Tax=Salinibacterium sp. ZJ70 TaxID=2708084 RepID=UPI00141DE494|nr:aromatic acid exporter family protein [Salinibacterium sp. ZJ70]